jgi:outer membrane protein TolC
MVMRFSLSLILMLLMLPLASEEYTLTAQSSVDLAMKNNLSLQIERIELSTDKRERDTAWNEFWPSLSVDSSLTHTKSYSSSTTGGSSSPWSYSLGITTRLPLSAAIPLSMRDAGLNYEAGVIALEEAERRLERDVKKAFYDLLLTQEEMLILKKSIETAQNNYDVARQNYEKGVVSEIDMLSAQVELETRKPDLRDIEVSYQTSLMEFKQIVGLKQEDEVRLKGTIEIRLLSLDATNLIENHLSKRTDIRGLVKAVQILENEMSLDTAEDFTPELTVSYSYTGNLSDPFNSQWLNGDNWARTGSLRFSLSVPLDPWFPASSSRVNRAETEDSLEQTRVELTEAKQLAQIEIRTLVLELAKSLGTIGALEKNEKLAQRVYDLREKEYRAGLTELLEVQEAFDDLQTAKLDVLKEKTNYLTSLLDLEYSLNADIDSP